jgi:hypothetical protein
MFSTETAFKLQPLNMLLPLDNEVNDPVNEDKLETPLNKLSPLTISSVCILQTNLSPL